MSIVKDRNRVFRFYKAQDAQLVVDGERVSATCLVGCFSTCNPGVRRVIGEWVSNPRSRSRVLRFRDQVIRVERVGP